MKYDDSIPFDEYFTYHPPQTQERKDKHERINNASLELARVIWDYIPSTDKDRDRFLNQIQIMRMMLNQAVTVAEIRQNKPLGKREVYDGYMTDEEIDTELGREELY